MKTNVIIHARISPDKFGNEATHDEEKAVHEALDELLTDKDTGEMSASFLVSSDRITLDVHVYPTE